jgi:hypothetical protein
MAKAVGCDPSFVNNTCSLDQLNLVRQSYALAHIFFEQDELSMAGGVLSSLEHLGTRAMFGVVYDKLSGVFGRSVVQKALDKYKHDMR